MANTTEELFALFEKIAQAQAKNEVVQAETSAMLKDIAAKHKELSQMLGGVANSQGDAAEEFFINSVTRHPVINGIRFDSLHPNLIVMKDEKKFAEFDMVLVNGKAAALFDVKYKPQVADLDKVLASLKKYREAFPEQAKYKLYGGVAGFSVSKAVINAAHKHGLFVLKCSADVFESQNKTLHSF
jgi:hypothetical protein